MNRWDALLSWLYERQTTDWQRVKQACRTLSLAEGIGEAWSPLAHASYWARPLIELGHVEFDDKNCLVACPPGIVITNDCQRGLLSGYWTKQRLRALHHTGIKRFQKVIDRGPTCLSVTGTHAKLQESAGICNVWIGNDPGDKILARLPHVWSWIEACELDKSSPNGSWEKLTFRDHRPIWTMCTEPFAIAGLYRRRNGQPICVHVCGEVRRRIRTPDQRYAAMWYESPMSNWHCDERRKCVLIPFGTPRLPVLLARSLLSGSGHLAARIEHRNRHWWRYAAVSLYRARRAAEILGQEVRIQEADE